MTPAEFVAHWRTEKDEMLRLFMGEAGVSLVSQKISSMGLNDQQVVALREVLDTALTDAFYSLLLGLDGVSSIGTEQHDYQVLDENGLVICGEGRVEAEAYAQFHKDA